MHRHSSRDSSICSPKKTKDSLKKLRECYTSIADLALKNYPKVILILRPAPVSPAKPSHHKGLCQSGLQICRHFMQLGEVVLTQLRDAHTLPYQHH